MNRDPAFILDSIFFRVPELCILEGVYLKVLPGIVCALFGRNGSGKSTLLKVGAGQLQPGTGITIIDGRRFHKQSLYERFSKIGYLPQDSMLPDDAAVKQLIKTFPSKTRLKQDPLIDKIHSQKVHELSGGERRYLEVSLLFSLERAYYLLDEPFTGVKPKIIDQLNQRIGAEAESGKGILLTDHYHRSVLQVADEAYLLQQKQCYKLAGDFHKELRKRGYLR